MTATETREQAVELAGASVKARLAAGAQINGPIISVFWHLGEFGQSAEWQLILKNTQGKYRELETFLIENHPWNNPEVIAVPIMAGSPKYLGWIAETLSHSNQNDQ